MVVLAFRTADCILAADFGRVDLSCGWFSPKFSLCCENEVKPAMSRMTIMNDFLISFDSISFPLVGFVIRKEDNRINWFPSLFGKDAKYIIASLNYPDS